MIRLRLTCDHAPNIAPSFTPAYQSFMPVCKPRRHDNAAVTKRSCTRRLDTATKLSKKLATVHKHPKLLRNEGCAMPWHPSIFLYGRECPLPSEGIHTVLLVAHPCSPSPSFSKTRQSSTLTCSRTSPPGIRLRFVSTRFDRQALSSTDELHTHRRRSTLYVPVPSPSRAAHALARL